MCGSTLWGCTFLFVVLVAACCCNWFSCLFCIGWLADVYPGKERRYRQPNIIPMYIPWITPGQQQQSAYISVPAAGGASTTRHGSFYAPPPTYDSEEKMGKQPPPSRRFTA